MMNLRKYYIIAGCLLYSLNMIAQDNVKLLTNWEYKRKPARYEKINKVISTTNGFIVAVGETSGDRFEDTDGLFILLSADGSLEQWRPINKPGNQAFNSVIQNHDGTFTLVGYDETKKGDRDGWVVDVDLNGELINRESLRGLAGHDDELYDLAINHSGTVLIAGVQDIGKTNEFWLLAKGLDGTTSALSSHIKVPGPTKQIIAMPDGSFHMVGSTDDKNREYPNQVWVAKISEEGRDLWGGIKYFGDKGWQEGISICPSPADGGLVIAGVTNSKGAGDLDMWLIKVDDQGDLIWDRTFGGANADRTASVTALSEGGYAILGHTWSHMPKANTSIMKVVAVNNDGEMLDDATYYIPDGRGNQLGYSIAESLSSSQVIYAGNSSSDKGSASQTWISGLDYKSPIDLAEIKSDDDDTYGTVSGTDLEIKTTAFIDANNSKYLEEGERGFVEVTVVNSSLETMSNVKANVSSNEKTDIKFWDQLYLGSLQAGQQKKLHIPVEASGNLSKSSYQLNINLAVNGLSAASTQAKITSNRPDPATLIVNKHSFAPGSNAEPGKPITLTLEIANTGGLNSDGVPAAFNVPAGVESLKNEKINIPDLAPQQTHIITFEFAYSEVFNGNNIKIEFESEGKGTLPGLRQSFNYGVANDQPVVEYVAAPANNMDIIWTSHDLNEFRTVDVNQREVNIKAIALANKELSKRNFAVLINGRRAQGQKLDESRLTPPENAQVGRMQQSYTDVVNLQEGENEVQVVYYDDDGEILGKSTPLIFNYVTKDAPNLYVLSIGVQHEDLQFTVNDAKKFAGMYSKLRDDKGRAFRKVSVLEMTKKEETTEKNIKRAFLNLTRNNAIKDNDLVVVFISSHGKVAEGNRYVLLPSDYDPQYEELSTIDFNEDILKRLRNIDGNKLLFIDACHSGSAGSRSFSDAAASKMMNDLIQATAGMEIFASCADNEFSYEDESWGNGAFTKAIIEAFNNETVDMDGKKINADIFAEINGVKDHGSDGVITIEELKLYVQKRVPYLVNSVKKKMQNPVNKSTDLLPVDMGIYLVN